MGGETKRLMKRVATTSFASTLLPERRPLERRTLVPIDADHAMANLVLFSLCEFLGKHWFIVLL